MTSRSTACVVNWVREFRETSESRMVGTTSKIQSCESTVQRMGLLHSMLSKHFKRSVNRQRQHWLWNSQQLYPGDLKKGNYMDDKRCYLASWKGVHRIIMTIVYDLRYWSESRDGRVIGGSVRMHARISTQPK